MLVNNVGNYPFGAIWEALDELAAKAKVGHRGAAEEIAEPIMFVASGRASFVYGASWRWTGGRIAV